MALVFRLRRGGRLVLAASGLRENSVALQGQSRYRGDIDGVRAIAVTSVVLFHAGLFPFRSGFVGVDIFFVISGYLIGGIILRETKDGRFDFAKFYARRARRILPALFVVVLSTCLAGWFLLDASELREVGATATSTLLAVSNISFWRFQEYFATDARLRPLLMTWSLGVEEQFYLFFPLFIIAMMRIAPAKLLTAFVVVTLVSFILAAWWATSYPAAAFYLLPPRAWELGVGAILAAWEIKQGALPIPLSGFPQSKWTQEALAWLSLLLLAVAVIGFDEHTRLPTFVVLLAVLGTATLISTERSWVNARLLSSRPMVFVGLISYSWYLWHWPLMSYLRIIVPTAPPVSVLVLIAAVSFAVAGLSWWFVERPFRSGTLRPGLTLRRYAAALAISLVAPITIKLANGLPQRLSDQTKQIEAVASVGGRWECLAWLERKLSLSAECVSDIKNRPAVALIGDSHAAALVSGFRELTAQQNLGFRIFTAGSCPPLLDVSVRSRIYPDLMEGADDYRAYQRKEASRFSGRYSPVAF
jgi:peptidoglycan/LPS O-acetylase OafA/YrhL